MVDEVLRCLRPAPGEIAVDCTLGGGGHALAILDRIQPGGRLIGIDVDPLELPRAEARLRAAGFGSRRLRGPAGKFRGTAADPRRGRARRRGHDRRRPRRLLDAARQPRSRLQLQGAGPARHADGPVGRRARVRAGCAARRRGARGTSHGERRRTACQAHRGPAEAVTCRHDERGRTRRAHGPPPRRPPPDEERRRRTRSAARSRPCGSRSTTSSAHSKRCCSRCRAASRPAAASSC